MKSSAKNINLNSYDDIFSTEETREDAKREKVMDIPLSELYPFPDHPFQVRDDVSLRAIGLVFGEHLNLGATASVGCADRFSTLCRVAPCAFSSCSCWTFYPSAVH